MLARLHRTLGRRDLALARLSHLRQRFAADNTVGSLWLQALLLATGAQAEAHDWLDEVARLADLEGGCSCFAPRRRVARRTAPLDRELAARLREAGAHGLAVSLLARRAAALLALGRVDEASASAAETWRCVEAGICSYDLLIPDLGALLCPALAMIDPPLARRIASVARAWMRDAAATLPLQWRDNYLARAPALQGLAKVASRV